MTARTRKVLAYVTRGDALLVFLQPEFPDAGLQVPAGTIEQGEDAMAAALREVEEESGLTGVSVTEFLGQYEFHMAPYRDELQERHVFHLVENGAAPATWRHWETHGGGSEPIEFEFFWKRLDGSDLGLAGGQGQLLPQLFERIRGRGPRFC